MEIHSWEFRNYSITISLVQSWELCFRFYNLKTMRNHQILFSEILVWSEFTGKSLWSFGGTGKYGIQGAESLNLSNMLMTQKPNKYIATKIYNYNK